MTTQLPARFWVEAALTGTSAGALVATLFARSWIEAIFAIDPDHGNGAVEWAITFVLVATTHVFARLSAAHIPTPTQQEGST